MPVKIVDSHTGQTRSELGEIKQSDLLTIKSEFVNNTAVSAVYPRTATINKRIAFFFDKAQFLELFDKKPGDLGVKINIGIQIDPTKDICDNNEGNNLCIVVETFPDKENKNPANIAGDYVLINGFVNNGTTGTDNKSLASPTALASASVCCPSSEPPPNSTPDN